MYDVRACATESGWPATSVSACPLHDNKVLADRKPVCLPVVSCVLHKEHETPEPPLSRYPPPNRPCGSNGLSDLTLTFKVLSKKPSLLLVRPAMNLTGVAFKDVQILVSAGTARRVR